MGSDGFGSVWLAGDSQCSSPAVAVAADDDEPDRCLINL